MAASAMDKSHPLPMAAISVMNPFWGLHDIKIFSALTATRKNERCRLMNHLKITDVTHLQSRNI
jgi:hypothetical protein